MSVTVSISHFMQSYMDGIGEITASGGTVAECLSELVERFPQSKEQLFNEQGKLHSHVGIFLNGEILMPGELEHELKEGDKLTIVNVIAGG